MQAQLVAAGGGQGAVRAPGGRTWPKAGTHVTSDAPPPRRPRLASGSPGAKHPGFLKNPHSQVFMPPLGPHRGRGTHRWVQPPLSCRPQRPMRLASLVGGDDRG